MSMLVYFILAALILDLLLGDPRSWPHPVVIMGRVISEGERLIRLCFSTSHGLRWGGGLLVLTVVGGTYLAIQGLLAGLDWVHPYLRDGAEIWLIYTSLAVKSLHEHTDAVAKPLVAGDLPKAREQVGLMVGRDTEQLNEGEITRAVVETVAENTMDGIVAPLFYAFLGGAPLALAYKAVNTLDSMIGYMEEPYRDLGMVAAKLDDGANYIPARITGLLLLSIAIFTPGGIKETWRIMKRDRRNHPSPNGGIIEAGVAGALGVQLGGLNYYFGQPSYRPIMGPSPGRPLEVKHIRDVIAIMYGITLGALFLGATIRWVFPKILGLTPML